MTSKILRKGDCAFVINQSNPKYYEEHRVEILGRIKKGDKVAYKVRRIRLSSSDIISQEPFLIRAKWLIACKKIPEKKLKAIRKKRMDIEDVLEKTLYVEGGQVSGIAEATDAIMELKR